MTNPEPKPAELKTLMIVGAPLIRDMRAAHVNNKEVTLQLIGTDFPFNQPLKIDRMFVSNWSDDTVIVRGKINFCNDIWWLDGEIRDSDSELLDGMVVRGSVRLSNFDPYPKK